MPPSRKPSAKKKISASHNPHGRGFGATRLAFEMLPSNGEVEMATWLHRENQVRGSLPSRTKKLLKHATGDHFWSPAMVALAEWALLELKRQKRRLIITDADKET
jgi:hypothetical protein